jgi:hypothetical protein
MTNDSYDSEIRRVSDEIVARLRARGVEASLRESPEDLVRLLEAVEEFERTVERHGGDLMVDEPIGSRPAANPDTRRFVLPTRAEHESIAAFVGRIAEARDAAANVHRGASDQ